MRRPTLALAVAINRAVRERDEWFDEPDDVVLIKAAAGVDVESEIIALLADRS